MNSELFYFRIVINQCGCFNGNLKTWRSWSVAPSVKFHLQLFALPAVIPEVAQFMINYIEGNTLISHFSQFFLQGVPILFCIFFLNLQVITMKQ